MRPNARSWSSCGASFARSKWSAIFWQRLARLVCRQKRAGIRDVYQLVKANQAELPVRALCETLQVSTSGYYDWRDRALSKRAQANIALSELIGQAHRASDQTYGMPRIRAELADTGINASRKRIARLMRAMRIQGVSRRRAWCATTERNKAQRPAPSARLGETSVCRQEHRRAVGR